MGKKSKAKPPETLLTIEGAKKQTYLDEFFRGKQATRGEGGESEVRKMAGVEEQMQEEAGEFENKDFKALEKNISCNVAAMLKPLKEQLSQIQTALIETKKIADCAMETALAVQEGSRNLQYEQDNMKMRLLAVEMDSKQFNIKIRGLAEATEQTLDLQSAMAVWLAKALSLEEGVTPVITKAYRLGARRELKTNKGPRDILVTFADLRVKNRIIKEARKSGFLMLNGQKTEIYNDLPLEAIQRRREMKPITIKLQKAQQRYRWVGPAKLMVLHKGTPIYATDFDTGLILLNTLGINLPDEKERGSVKRKLNLLDTPTKDN